MASCTGTRLIPRWVAISLRSTRSPVRSLPVSTRLRMWDTTWSFSLTPYFFGIRLFGLYAPQRWPASHECGNPLRCLTDESEANANRYVSAVIAPAAQRLGGGQVVIRAVAADGQQRDAEGREALRIG